MKDFYKVKKKKTSFFPSLLNENIRLNVFLMKIKIKWKQKITQMLCIPVEK